MRNGLQNFTTLHPVEGKTRTWHHVRDFLMETKGRVLYDHMGTRVIQFHDAERILRERLMLEPLCFGAPYLVRNRGKPTPRPSRKRCQLPMLCLHMHTAV